MDRCVVARNGPNRRVNVLAAIGYDSPGSPGRCLTLAPFCAKRCPNGGWAVPVAAIPSGFPQNMARLALVP